MSAAALHGLKPHGFKLRDRGVRLATGYIKAKHFLHVKRNSSCCGLKQFSQRQCKSVRKELLDSLYTSVFVMLAFRDMLSKHPLPYKAHVQSNAKNRITCTIWNLKKKYSWNFSAFICPPALHLLWAGSFDLPPMTSCLPIFVRQRQCFSRKPTSIPTLYFSCVF